MARCFVTGVEFGVADGYVLNRVDAHRLLRRLKSRAEVLQRLIDQLSPLDVGSVSAASIRRTGRQHRLICHAVANAFGSAFPEIELFLSWPKHRARNLAHRLAALKEHPLFGGAISQLAEEEILAAAELGEQVLRLVDPRRALPQRAQLAVRAGIAVRHRHVSAEGLASMIRAAVEDSGGLDVLGVPEEEHDLFRSGLLRVTPLFRAAAPTA